MSRPVQTVAVGLLVVIAAVTSTGVVLALDNASQTNQLAVDAANTSETITVSARGTAQAPPDKAVLRMAVEARNSNVTVARTAVAEDVSNVHEALATLGIDEDQIQTSDYRIYEDHRRERPTDGKTPPEYRVRHVLTVDVEDTESVGAVIDAAVDAGVTNVHDVRFTLSSETERELKNEALENAMADAGTQAETLAQSGDLQIEGVSTIETGRSGTPRPVYAMEYAGGADSGTDVSTGPVTVSTRVTVTYEASR